MTVLRIIANRRFKCVTGMAHMWTAYGRSPQMQETYHTPETARKSAQYLE